MGSVGARKAKPWMDVFRSSKVASRKESQQSFESTDSADTTSSTIEITTTTNNASSTVGGKPPSISSISSKRSASSTSDGPPVRSWYRKQKSSPDVIVEPQHLQDPSSPTSSSADSQKPNTVTSAVRSVRSSSLGSTNTQTTTSSSIHSLSSSYDLPPPPLQSIVSIKSPPAPPTLDTTPVPPPTFSTEKQTIQVHHNPTHLGGVLSPGTTKWYHFTPAEINIPDALNSSLGTVDAYETGSERFVLDLSKLDRDEIKRQEVVFELITTEREYLRDLQITINVFQNPMKEKSILPAIKIALVFSNIEQLLPLSQELLSRLLQRRRERMGVVDRVGDIFLEMGQYLNMYKIYCGNQPEAVAFLKNQRGTNNELNAFLQACFQLPECRSLDLPSFLLKPIQRICKYPLLLKELMKHTPEAHVDSANLKAAYEIIGGVVDSVNERRRFLENQQKMLAALSKLEFEKGEKLNHEPTRRFLHEGPLIRHVSKTLLGATQSRYGILFNDFFILAKPNMLGGKMGVNKVIPLGECEVKDISDTEKHKNAFMVMWCRKKVYFFSTGNGAEKQGWVDGFEAGIWEANNKVPPPGVSVGSLPPAPMAVVETSSSKTSQQAATPGTLPEVEKTGTPASDTVVFTPLESPQQRTSVQLHQQENDEQKIDLKEFLQTLAEDTESAPMETGGVRQNEEEDVECISVNDFDFSEAIPIDLLGLVGGAAQNPAEEEEEKLECCEKRSNGGEIQEIADLHVSTSEEKPQIKVEEEESSSSRKEDTVVDTEPWKLSRRPSSTSSSKPKSRKPSVSSVLVDAPPNPADKPPIPESTADPLEAVPEVPQTSRSSVEAESRSRRPSAVQRKPSLSESNSKEKSRRRSSVSPASKSQPQVEKTRASSVEPALESAEISRRISATVYPAAMSEVPTETPSNTSTESAGVEGPPSASTADPSTVSTASSRSRSVSAASSEKEDTPTLRRSVTIASTESSRRRSSSSVSPGRSTPSQQSSSTAVEKSRRRSSVSPAKTKEALNLKTETDTKNETNSEDQKSKVVETPKRRPSVSPGRTPHPSPTKTTRERSITPTTPVRTPSRTSTTLKSQDAAAASPLVRTPSRSGTPVLSPARRSRQPSAAIEAKIEIFEPKAKKNGADVQVSPTSGSLKEIAKTGMKVTPPPPPPKPAALSANSSVNNSMESLRTSSGPITPHQPTLAVDGDLPLNKQPDTKLETNSPTPTLPVASPPDSKQTLQKDDGLVEREKPRSTRDTDTENEEDILKHCSQENQTFITEETKPWKPRSSRSSRSSLTRASISADQIGKLAQGFGAAGQSYDGFFGGRVLTEKTTVISRQSSAVDVGVQTSHELLFEFVGQPSGVFGKKTEEPNIESVWGQESNRQIVGTTNEAHMDLALKRKPSQVGITTSSRTSGGPKREAMVVDHSILAKEHPDSPDTSPLQSSRTPSQSNLPRSSRSRSGSVDKIGIPSLSAEVRNDTEAGDANLPDRGRSPTTAAVGEPKVKSRSNSVSRPSSIAIPRPAASQNSQAPLIHVKSSASDCSSLYARPLSRSGSISSSSTSPVKSSTGPPPTPPTKPASLSSSKEKLNVERPAEPPLPLKITTATTLADELAMAATKAAPSKIPQSPSMIPRRVGSPSRPISQSTSPTSTSPTPSTPTQTTSTPLKPSLIAVPLSRSRAASSTSSLSSDSSSSSAYVMAQSTPQSSRPESPSTLGSPWTADKDTSHSPSRLAIPASRSRSSSASGKTAGSIGVSPLKANMGQERSPGVSTGTHQKPTPKPKPASLSNSNLSSINASPATSPTRRSSAGNIEKGAGEGRKSFSKAPPSLPPKPVGL
ncbi:Myosin 10A, isoform D [Chytridiales sp. JEL 0842]|nr:Myosin 10A, isoform D [Chytridiales sp. JEL 0842]